MILSDKEINSLLNQSPDQEKSSVHPLHVNYWDITSSPQRLQAKIAAIELLHETFCLEGALAITQLIGQNVYITSQPTEIMSFYQYLATCYKSTLYYSMRLMPYDKLFLLAFSNLFITNLINSLFGGETSTDPARKLGQFEIRMGNRLMTAFTRALQNVWKSKNLEVAFQIANTAFNARLMAIAQPSEHIIVTRFSCIWGNTSHDFSVVYPETLLNTITGLLNSTAYCPNTPEAKNWQSHLKAALVRTPVELAITLPEIHIKLHELLTLQVGDILPIASPTHAIMTIDGQKIFVGKSTQYAGNHAIVIDKPL